MLLFNSADQTQWFIQLVNVATGETREVAEGLVTGVRFGGLDQSIVWSPNSQYLAYILDSLDDRHEANDLDAYIYAIADDSQINITHDDLNQYRVAWSSDSTTVVSSAESCPQRDTNCMVTFDTFDAGTGNRLKSFRTSDLRVGSGTIEVCGLDLSPNKRYMSFISPCSGIPETPTDVYIWDTETEAISQITDIFSSGEIPLYMSYNVIWSDNDNLLIEGTYQLQAENHNQILNYNVISNETSILSIDERTIWTVNPNSGDLLVYSSPIVEDANQIQIATYSSNGEDTLIPLSLETSEASFNISLGCQVYWSPDGQTIAYTLSQTGDCGARIEKVTFVDITSGSIQEHDVALDNLEGVIYTLPLGWVAR